MAHPVRIRIKFPPATAAETAKALGIRPAEMRVAEALVKRLLTGPKRPRKRKAPATGTSMKSA